MAVPSHEDDAHVGPSQADDLLAYVGDMIDELKAITLRHDWPMLAALLELASVEARRELRRHDPER